MSLQDKLKTARELYEAQVQAIAGQYRGEVLIPLCRKYRMEFVQGMGTWFFGPLDRDIPEPDVKAVDRHGVRGINHWQNYTFSSVVDINQILRWCEDMAEDHEDEGEPVPEMVQRYLNFDLSPFEEVCETLDNTMVGNGGNDCFGYWIADIREKDY